MEGNSLSHDELLFYIRETFPSRGRDVTPPRPQSKDGDQAVPAAPAGTAVGTAAAFIAFPRCL